MIACSAGISGCAARSGGLPRSATTSSSREPVVVREAQDAVAALARRRGAAAQKSSAASEATPSWSVWIIPAPGAAAARAPANSNQVRIEPGEPGLVAEVEVVGVGRVEVDGLLDQPQAEHVGVEVDVRAARRR